MSDGKPSGLPTGAGPCSALILPGVNGSGVGHWQTAWEASLPGARRVQARDWARPACAEWMAALEQAVAEAGPDVVLVAHSLGCLQVVHWAQRTVRSVGGALLVAPPDPDAPAFPRQAVGFTPLPRTSLPFPSILVASADDPYASVDFSLRCARAWGSRFVDLGCQGHVNADSAVGEWREGRPLLDELLTRRIRPLGK